MRKCGIISALHKSGGYKIRRTVCKIDTKVTKRMPMPIIGSFTPY